MKAPPAQDCGARLTRINATIETGVLLAQPTSPFFARDVASAASQLSMYLQSQVSCLSTRIFAKSGNAVVGLYAAAGIGMSSLSALLGRYESLATKGGNILQFCEAKDSGNRTVGIIAAPLSALGSVNEAVNTWANRGCLDSSAVSHSAHLDILVHEAPASESISESDGSYSTSTNVENSSDNCQKADRTYSTETPSAGTYMNWDFLSPLRVKSSGRQFITIVNLTPHRFKLVHTHSYQMDSFDFGDVPQGHARQNLAHYTEKAGTFPVDDNGEAYYSIDGTDKKFTIRATTHIPHAYPRRTVFDLTGMNMGQREYLDPSQEASVTLVITGSNEYGFITSIRHGAGNWMRSLYHVIKDRQLQHVVMPGTHDSGMSTISNKIVSLGVEANTQTQGLNMYDQLRTGARWFDLRISTVHNAPFEADYDFWTLHVNDERADIAVGNSGVSLDDIVREINRFTMENPGEIVFLRVKYLIGIRKIPSFGPIYWTDEMVRAFFSKLRGIRNRCPHLDAAVPFNRQKVSYFMDQNEGKGCVIILLDGQLTSSVPQESISDGIYKASRMRFWDNWSNKADTQSMAQDQAADWKTVMRSGDPGNSDDRFLIGQWLVSADAVKTTALTIQKMAILPTNPALYWMGVNNMSPERWPNVLLIDYIGIVVRDQTAWNQLSAEMYTLAIGLNLYMISENCDISPRRSPLLAKARPMPLSTNNVVTAAPWNGIIYANGTVQDFPPRTSHPGRTRILHSGTRFLNGTVLTKDVKNPNLSQASM
ncbi:hypothetical protein RJ55_02385 [Drechmeria coniospora]|nr:hypothetical protein RJ55_02385 [Drechmeria coniospora]